MDDSPIIHAFKHMQVPLMIVGPDERILHCNGATARLFGYDLEALIGRPVSDVLPVDSPAGLNSFIEPPAIDAIVEGVVGQRRNGDPVVLAIHITAWTHPERGLQHALVLRHIADEMNAEQYTRDELNRANSAITGARIGVFEFNPTSDWLSVSDIWCELLELDASDIPDVRREWCSRVHPDDLDRVQAMVQRCAEKDGGRANCEYRFRSKDGQRWLWMRSNLAVTRRDRTGRVIRLSGTMTDITQTKEAENALRVSEAMFRSGFENATIGMALVGRDGALLRVNPSMCDLFGYSEDELLRTDFQTLTHPEDLAADLERFDRLLAGRIPAYQIEKRYIRANGAVMWGLLSVGAVASADGKPEHVISQITDVTEQRRLSERKGAFVATVSHELRTPLTSILGSLSLLSSMEDEPFSDEAQRLLFIAQKNGERLNALVDDILDFEKLSARELRFKPSRQRIVALVEDAVSANLALSDRFGVHFDITCPKRTISGFVDPKRFQQVMTNLLANAAKFADRDAAIEIGVEDRKKYVRVSVSNYGEGIPESLHDRIFEPFSQAAPSMPGSQTGTGLGLSITKQIVEQMGGDIGFDSGPGGKTTFWINVPVEDPR